MIKTVCLTTNIIEQIKDIFRENAILSEDDLLDRINSQAIVNYTNDSSSIDAIALTENYSEFTTKRLCESMRYYATKKELSLFKSNYLEPLYKMNGVEIVAIANISGRKHAGKELVDYIKSNNDSILLYSLFSAESFWEEQEFTCIEEYIYRWIKNK